VFHNPPARHSHRCTHEGDKISRSRVHHNCMGKHGKELYSHQHIFVLQHANDILPTSLSIRLTLRTLLISQYAAETTIITAPKVEAEIAPQQLRRTYRQYPAEGWNGEPGNSLVLALRDLRSLTPDGACRRNRFINARRIDWLTLGSLDHTRS
jgi:hypothetical protein